MSLDPKKSAGGVFTNKKDLEQKIKSVFQQKKADSREKDKDKGKKKNKNKKVKKYKTTREFSKIEWKKMTLDSGEIIDWFECTLTTKVGALRRRDRKLTQETAIGFTFTNKRKRNMYYLEVLSGPKARLCKEEWWKNIFQNCIEENKDLNTPKIKKIEPTEDKSDLDKSDCDKNKRNDHYWFTDGKNNRYCMNSVFASDVFDQAKHHHQNYPEQSF